MSLSFSLLIIFLLVVGAGIIFAAFVKSHHFIKSFIFSAVTGVGALLAVHFTSLMTGFSLPVNIVSLLVSGFGGMPGVIGMAVIKFI